MPRKKAPSGFGSIRKKIVSGRTYFEGRYTDPFLHKQKSVSATTEKECRAKLKAVLVSIESGTYTTPQKISFEKFSHDWLHGRQNISPGSYKIYERNLRVHLLPTLGGMQMRDIRPAHCQALVNALSDKGLSAASISSVTAILHKIFVDAVRLEIIITNPASNLEKPPISRKKPSVLLPSERAAFLSAIKGNEFEAVFLTCLHTGARIGEVLGLTWDRVDLSSGAITIDRQFDSVTKTIRPTKTGNTRKIYAPQTLIYVLKDLRRTQLEHKLKAGRLWQDLNFVFSDPIGRPYTYPRVEHSFFKITQAIGREDLTLHSLRHTYATDEIASGVDPKTVADTLGHTTTAMTMDIYATASVDKKIAAAKRRDEDFAEHQ